MNSKLKASVNRFVKQYSGNKNIIGIVYLDRPSIDKEDDVDIVIFVKNKARIQMGERIFESLDFDVSVLDYFYAKKTQWGQETRACFKHSVIIFDTGRKIKKLLAGKLRFTEEERKNILVSNIFDLIWLGIYDNHRWSDYPASYYPHDLWIRRGDVESAHVVLDLGLGLLLNILYAYNKELIPSEKWKLHTSYSLKWIPKNYKKKMDALIEIKKVSKSDFERRYRIIRELLEEIIDKAEKKKLLPEKPYHYFLKHDGFYSLHPQLH